ncbi:MAG: TlpA family protein disulfide reductase [Hyphomicrobiales bacterium]
MKNFFKRIIRKRGRKKLIGDLVFAVVILFFLIPSTRMYLSSSIIRLFSMSPSIESNLKEVAIPTSVDNWELRKRDGSIVHFKDLRGKPIFINFWATWCPPCVAEMPSIQKLYDKYKGKVNFILVSNESGEKVRAFLDKHDYDFPIYYTLEQTPQVFSSSSIPATFIINTNGNLVLKHFGVADWDSDNVHEIFDKD